MPSFRCTRRAPFWLAGLVAGCGNSAPTGSDASVPDDPWTGAEVRCDDSDVRVLRVLPWPGGGLQILLESTVDAISMEEAEGAPVASEVSAVTTGRGLTAVLLVPALAPEVHEQRRAAARVLLRDLPDRERVALFVAPVAAAGELSDGGAGSPAQAVADLGRDRGHLLARLEEIGPADGHAAAPAVAALSEALAAVEGSFGAVHRDLLVVGEAPVVAEEPAYRPVEATWLDEAGTAAFDPVLRYAGWGGDRTPEEAAGEVVAHIGQRRATTLRVGACPPPASTELVLRVGSTTCTLVAPDPVSHLADGLCAPAAAAIDAYPYPTEIELIFTADERAVYDGFYQAQSKDEFAASVRLGAGSPIPASAHFRGQTSLSCDRKSLFVDLGGAAPRRVLPGAASDRFLLISMCKDAGYFGQVFADRLMAALELFPLRFGYVRLRIDGVNQGVYLLLEHPDRALVTDLLAARAVIRRRFDPDGISPEVGFPVDADGAAEALDRYLAVVALAEEGPVEGLDTALGKGLDLDSYLRWLALNSLLENGDNVDETHFYASEEAGDWWFRVAGWDPDDIFEACHHGGIWALEDACGLLYCAEADLDRSLIRSPAVYRRFGAALAAVSEALPAAELRATMEAVREELFATLADDETASAMVELIGEVPSAATAAGAREEIAARMESVLQAAEARRAWLLDRISSCPEMTP